MENLERELIDRILLHKASVIKAVAMKYYSDIYDSEVNLPEFIESKKYVIERKASKYLLELANDREHFNQVYANCWNRIKELLP